MKKACEYLLIGQGLAGTSLGIHLMEAGADVLIMEDQRAESSSRVAAGLYNPVTGRKMVKTWMADTLFPYLENFYQRMESLTGQKFLHQRPIYRPFVSVEEQNEWMGKSASADFKDLVSRVATGPYLDHVNDPYGGILLEKAGFLDIPAYLDAMVAWFSSQHRLVSGTFSPDALHIRKEGVNIGEIEAKKIVFCDGTFAAGHTFFNWLPFRPVKGELLEVSLPVHFPAIVNRGVFVLELEDGLFRVGSTYNNREPDWQPSADGREYLLEKLSALVPVPAEVKRHYAGVRPATADRRPILGFHPEHETIALFNGLGTKGVSLSPWFGKHLSEHFLSGKPLLDEVNISRYFSLY